MKKLVKLFEEHRVAFAAAGVLGSIGGFVISMLDLDSAIKKRRQKKLQAAPKK